MKNIKNIFKSKIVKYYAEKYKNDIKLLELSIEFYREKVSSYDKSLELYANDSKKFDAINHVYDKTVSMLNSECMELDIKRKKLDKMLSL